MDKACKQSACKQELSKYLEVLPDEKGNRIFLYVQHGNHDKIDF